MTTAHPSRETLLAEYQQLTQRAAQVDFSDRSRIRLRGQDRQSFLHNLCTNEIKKLASGDGCEAFVTNVQGKCIGHIFVAATEDSLEVETVPAQTEFLLSHLDRYLITEDVELDDTTSQAEVLVCGTEVVERFKSAGVSLPEVMYQHSSVSLGSNESPIAARIQRVPICGRTPSWLIRADVSQSQLQTTLEAMQIPVASHNALEMVRVEAGFPWFGQEITDANLPQEVDRNDVAISFVKGCYLGQETVARLDALGHVNKQLAAVALEIESTIERSTTITVDRDKEVGRVTSSAWSPTLERLLVLCFLRVAQLEPGTKLKVGEAEGTVIKLPVEA